MKTLILLLCATVLLWGCSDDDKINSLQDQIDRQAIEITFIREDIKQIQTVFTRKDFIVWQEYCVLYPWGRVVWKLDIIDERQARLSSAWSDWIYSDIFTTPDMLREEKECR
jgi:hypothetical protein